MDNVTFNMGETVMTGFHPGFWAWVFLHPWMTFFICLSICEALEAWGNAFGKRKK